MILETFKAVDWFLVDSIEEIEIPYKKAVVLEKESIAFSAFDGEGCIGCAGLMFWSADEAEVWLRMDKRILDSPRPAIRAIREGFDLVMPKVTARVFAWVDEDLPRNQRFIRWMGFTPTEETKVLYGKNIRLYESVRS